MSIKRAIATATRVVCNEESTGDRDAIATAARVVGVEEGNDEGSKGDGDGNGNKEGTTTRAMAMAKGLAGKQRWQQW